MLVIGIVLLGLIIGPSRAAAAENYVLPFIATQNWPEAQATMEIQFRGNGTYLHLTVRHAAPNMLYTLWTVFNELVWPLPTSGHAVPSTAAQRRVDPVYGPFPSRGNGVSPVAPLKAAFRDGMGLDPGITFYTDAHGNGDVDIALDYDLIRAAPVSNRKVITQSVCTTGRDFNGRCSGPEVSVSITTTWLRQFIADFPVNERAALCANYEPSADPEDNRGWQSGGDNALLWQCMDPDTVNKQGARGRALVYQYAPDHFRLAAHLDDFTHGFIGGNATDHRIDMVGRMQDLLRVK